MADFSQYQYVWKATVYPDSLHIFQQEIDNKKRGSQTTYLNNFMDNKADGLISKNAAKRIEKAIVWLLFHSKPKYIYDVELKKRFHFRINFITLTLPAQQFHSDDEVKKTCLNNFLNLCRQQHNLKSYIWKAEAQINGNIHFHLVTDCYIRYDKIHQFWNQSVELLGYVSRFEERIGHSHPNSTDVHSVKHVKKIASYVSKYMSKNRSFKCIGELRNIKEKVVEIMYGTDQYRKESADKKEGKVVGHIIDGPIRKIEGRLWFLSRNLSACKPIRVSETEYNFVDLQSVVAHGNFFQLDTDFCINYYGKVATATKVYAPWLHSLMTVGQLQKGTKVHHCDFCEVKAKVPDVVHVPNPVPVQSKLF